MAAKSIVSGYQGARDAWGHTAEEDLRWLYEQSGAAVGFRAQSYEGGGNAVFDEEASHRAHMAHRQSRVRDAVDRMARISSRLAALTMHERETLRLAFTPRPWVPAMREAFRVGSACLAGVACVSLEVQAMRARARKPGGSVAEWLAWETASCAAAKRYPAWLRRVRGDVAAQVERALAGFEAAE